MSTIFKSGLYSTFSNSTIMNKNKQVSHSISGNNKRYFHAPLPQIPSAPPPPPKYSVTEFDLTEIPKIIVLQVIKRC